MPACTFFGHRDSSASIRPVLRQTILSLICDHGVTTFYVGHQGRLTGWRLGFYRN